MREVFMAFLGIVLLLVTIGCKPSGDSMGSMTKSGDGSTSATSPSTMATAYTCSMHPEVTSDKPGKCPKCGMELVAKK